jgi:hypothetical protein
MAFKYFKTFEKDNLADAAVYEDSWTADEDLVIKRVYIKNKDGSAFTDSTFYFKISEIVYTHPLVPAAILGPDVLVTPVLDIPFASGQKLDFTFKNLEGATISLFVVFEVFAS